MLIQVFDDVWVDPALVQLVSVQKHETEVGRYAMTIGMGDSETTFNVETREAALVFARGTIAEINKALGCGEPIDLEKLVDDLCNAVGSRLAFTGLAMEKASCDPQVLEGYYSGSGDARQEIRAFFERLQNHNGV